MRKPPPLSSVVPSARVPSPSMVAPISNVPAPAASGIIVGPTATTPAAPA